MIQRVFGTLLFLTLCMGSSAAVPDMDEPYAGILDMAERRTTFAVTDDGAVYSASWGDFGPSLALDPADAEREDFVLAMELRDPKKLRLKSWAGPGFAIDQNDTLWGWGSSLSGTLGIGLTEGGSDEPVRILDEVSDVRQSTELTLALRTDDSLWVWGGTWSTRPVKVMDDVAAISDGGLVLTQSGEVWACWFTRTLPEQAVSPDIFERYVPVVTADQMIISDEGQFEMEQAWPDRIPENMYLVLERKLSGSVKVDGQFAFDVFGGVWLIDANTADSHAVRLCADGKQADIQSIAMERCALVLGQDGVLRMFGLDGSGGQTVAENVAQIVRGTRRATYIDNKGQLWRIGGDGTASLLGSNVLFAVGCTDDFVAYIKSDRTLWLAKDAGVPQKVLENMKLPE